MNNNAHISRIFDIEKKKDKSTELEEYKALESGVTANGVVAHIQCGFHVLHQLQGHEIGDFAMILIDIKIRKR